MLNMICCAYRYVNSWEWSVYFVWSQKQVILPLLPKALSVFSRPRETEGISIRECCWHKQAGSTQQAGTVWISQGSLPWTVVWDTRWIIDHRFWLWNILLSLEGYLFLVGMFAEFSQEDFFRSWQGILAYSPGASGTSLHFSQSLIDSVDLMIP